jgi:hypothetical protein
MNAQTEIDLKTYDMYVLDNGGIPLFAGCTVSDYCKEHMEEHPLHTGFIAAIRSFGKEVFAGYPEKLNFGHLKLTFKNEGKFTIVFVNPDNSEDALIFEKMNKLSKLFKEKYEKDIEYFYVSDEKTSQFEADMIKLGIVPHDHIKSTRDYFVTNKGESDKKSVSIISRFKHKFSSLVKN